MKRLLHSFATAFLVLVGGTQLAAEPLQMLPTSAGYQPKDAVEQGLWLEMDEAERQMRASKFLIEDPELNAYVKGVLCRAVGTDKCGAARIYIMRTPQFNAAMAPNGMMLVWSGLLLRARNEAELAAVLGHEFVHFEQQHSLKSFRDIKAKSDAMTWLGFVPGGMLAQIGLMGSVFRFNREMEKQADMVALDYLSASGYDPMAPSKIWEQFLAEMEVQAKANKVGAITQDGSDFFSSHPNTRDRMEYLRVAARRKAPSDDDGAERYRAAIAQWWPRLIDDQVKLNDFTTTEFLLEGLSRGDWTADLLYARGELYRTRGRNSDLQMAEGLYRQSLAKDPALAASARNLGMLLLRQGKLAEGRKLLRRYLDIYPAASDRLLIESLAREPQK
jgi:predicted Zn-dependent protease